MSTQTKFYAFILDLGKGVHHLHASGDTLKVYLTNATPDATTHAVKADIAEVTAEHGYVAGGVDIQNDYTQGSGTGTMVSTDVAFTATGGTVGPFQYAVIYNDTATGDPLVSYINYGSAITLQDGDTVSVDFDETGVVAIT